MNGFDDAGWNKLQSDLESYRLSEFLEIHQKYLDQYLAS
jgi:putative aldouronate transport system substrate-binding protein